MTQYDADQMDRCDVCSTKIERRKLVRTQVRFVRPEGSNYLLYSSYYNKGSSFWSGAAGSRVGAMGLAGSSDEHRITIADDNGEILPDPGFEDVDGSGGWDEWTDVGGVVESTIIRNGSYSCKLSGSTNYVLETISSGIDEACKYDLSFWTRGDGTNAGFYQVINYNASGSTDIITKITTGVSQTGWEKVSVSFTTPPDNYDTGIQLQIKLYGPTSGAAYFDDASLKKNSIYVDCPMVWTSAGGSSGLFRSYTTGVDVSGLTQFVFSAGVGPQIKYYSDGTAGTQTDSPSSSALAVAMGICDGDGNNKALQRTWTDVNSLTRCWFQMDVADIASPLSSSGIYVYLDISAAVDDDWWVIDDLSIEGDVAKPTQFYTTTGAAVLVTLDTKSMAMVKVCPNCRERLTLESEQYGRPREQRVEAPVASAPQQV